MPIIALCGFSGSGKDTVANILISNYGYTKISFGSALKDVLSIVFGWDRTMLEGITPEDREKRNIVDTWWANKLNIPELTPKMMMMYIGTNIFRNSFHKDIWTLIVMRQLSLYDRIVITDCRFPNEITMIKENGGKLYFIQRNKPIWFDNYKQGMDCQEAEQLHDSEKTWIREDFDGIIVNDGSISDLDNIVSKFIYKI